MSSLAVQHPVRVAAEAAVRAADRALEAAIAFEQCCQIKCDDSAASSDRDTNSSSSSSAKIMQANGRDLPSRTYPAKYVKDDISRHLCALLGPKKGLGSGKRPNVRWRAVTDAVLALHPRYTPLPDAMDIQFKTLADLTQFSQGSWQNEEIHKSRITTRNLVHALGLSTCSVLAKGLAIPKKRVGLGGVRRLRLHLAQERPTSYGYLCKTTMNCRDVVIRPSGDISDGTDRWMVEKDGTITSGVEPLLSMQICFGQPKVGERLIVYVNSADTQVKFWKVRPMEQSPGHFQIVGTGRGENFCIGVPPAKRAVTKGPQQVIMMERETHTAPESWSDQTAWAYDEGGTFTHVATGMVLCIDTQKGRLDATATAVMKEKVWVNAPVDHKQNKHKWSHLLRPNLPDHITQMSDRMVPTHFRNAGELALAWGGVQEAVALLAIINEFPAAMVEEIGCAMLETHSDDILEKYGVDIADLPLIGASPDGILVRANGEREVVEVKTVCPFQQDGKGKKGFQINASPKPYSFKVNPSHMPQIQMEMLCTNTQVCNYISATSTHGVALFRVARSEEYIQAMLQVLSRLESNILSHNAPDERPAGFRDEAQFFLADPLCPRLRDLSIELAEKTRLWRLILPTEVQRSDKPSNLWL